MDGIPVVEGAAGEGVAGGVVDESVLVAFGAVADLVPEFGECVAAAGGVFAVPAFAAFAVCGAGSAWGWVGVVGVFWAGFGWGFVVGGGGLGVAVVVGVGGDPLHVTTYGR